MSTWWRDWLQLDNANGDLTIRIPEGGDAASYFNITSNLSLACLTQLARETRALDNLDGCFQFTYDFLVLRGAEVHFWPPTITFPWEQAALAPTNAPAPAAAYDPGNPMNLTLGSQLAFSDPYHEEADAVVYPSDVWVFLFIFWFFLLLLSTGCASVYYDPYQPLPPQRVILVSQRDADADNGDDDDGDGAAR